MVMDRGWFLVNHTMPSSTISAGCLIDMMDATRY